MVYIMYVIMGNILRESSKFGDVKCFRMLCLHVKVMIK